MHKKMVHYTFDENGKQAFIVAHDELCERKQAIPDDEDRRGVLSKAKGQLARLAMILHSLRIALADEPVWDTMVTKEDVDHAKVIIDFVIEQKFRLMPPEMKVVAVASCAQMFLTTILQNSWVLKANKFRLVMYPSSGSCRLHL